MSEVTNKNKKLAILVDVLGDYNQQGDEYLFYCPFCDHHKRKLSVNLKKGVAKCWVCRWSAGTLHFLIQQAGGASDKQEWSRLEDTVDFSTGQPVKDTLLGNNNTDIQKTASLPDDYKPLAHNCNQEAINYLKSREIGLEEVYRWQIGYGTDSHYGRLIVPSFGPDGDVNYYVARSYDGVEPKYLTADSIKHTNIIFNHLYINWSKPVTLVEGVFDAMKAGENVIPLLGSHLDEESKLFSKLVKEEPKIYITLDSDAFRKEVKTIKKLRAYDLDCYSIDIEPYDDVGEMSKKEFQKRKENATLVTSNKLDVAVLKQ